MILKERCISILVSLSQKNNFTVNKLSEILKVDSRTIRYDIEEINNLLRKLNLEQIKRSEGGVLILNLSCEMINELLSKFIKLTSEDRKDYLKLKIFSTNLVNLTKEAEKLDVSRTTLKKDLSEIRKEFEFKKIYINDIPSKGIKIMGEEEDIIECLKYEIKKNIKKEFNQKPLKIKELIIEIFKKNYSLSFEEFLTEHLNQRYTGFIYTDIFSEDLAIEIRTNLTGLKIERKKGLSSENKKINSKLMEIKLIKIEELFREFEIELGKDVFYNLSDEFDNKNFEDIFTEKIFQMNFYKNICDVLKLSLFTQKEIKIICYVLYNKILLKEYEKLKLLKVLLISDELDIKTDILLNRLKNILKFETIEVIPSCMFNIFDIKKKFDLVISSQVLKNDFNNLIYQIGKFPLEEEFVDLKFFLLKKENSKKNGIKDNG